MTPDYESAALRATETLIRHQISAAPIEPLPMLKAIPGVFVVSFTEMAAGMDQDRESLLHQFGANHMDAVTYGQEINGQFLYFVAYNQRLPFYMLQRALAREMGHMLLGHDGSRPEAVREEEALCFARHLICPRPLIRAVMEAGVPMSIETVGNITGCYEQCLKGIRRTPGAHVPADLNRLLKEQFADYVKNLLAFQSVLPPDDSSAPADFGTYMDLYEE